MPKESRQRLDPEPLWTNLAFNPACNDCWSCQSSGLSFCLVHTGRVSAHSHQHSPEPGCRWMSTQMCFWNTKRTGPSERVSGDKSRDLEPLRPSRASVKTGKPTVCFKICAFAKCSVEVWKRQEACHDENTNLCDLA